MRSKLMRDRQAANHKAWMNAEFNFISVISQPGKQTEILQVGKAEGTYNRAEATVALTDLAPILHQICNSNEVVELNWGEGEVLLARLSIINKETSRKQTWMMELA